MKIYTLRIVYNDKTGELKSLDEIIEEDEAPISITASPHVMEAIAKADLIEQLLVSHPGESVGEAWPQDINASV